MKAFSPASAAYTAGVTYAGLIHSLSKAAAGTAPAGPAGDRRAARRFRAAQPPSARDRSLPLRGEELVRRDPASDLCKI
jgi:hypothetical protein